MVNAKETLKSSLLPLSLYWWYPPRRSILPTIIIIIIVTFLQLPTCHATIATTKVVVDLSQPLQTSPYYSTSSPGYNFLYGIFQSVRTTKSGNLKMEAVIVLEKGQIVYEKYRDTPYKSINQTSNLYSTTKSIMSMIIGHMIYDNPNIQLSMSDTIGSIFSSNYYQTNVWNQMTNETEKVYLQQNVTIQNLLQMTSGLVEKQPFSFDSSSFTNLYLFHNEQLEMMLNQPSGGNNLLDTLSMVTFLDDGGSRSSSSSAANQNPSRFYYLGTFNLLSYVILEKSGMSPRKYFSTYFLKHLGIENDDIDWMVNNDGVELSYTGLKLTPRQMAKIGQLLLQGGMTGPVVEDVEEEDGEEDGAGGGDHHDNHNHRRGKQLLSKDWIRNATMLDLVDVPSNVPGNIHTNVKYGYLFWSSPDYGYYCAYGVFGHYICVQPSSERVYVQVVEDDLISLRPTFDASQDFISHVLHPSMSFMDSCGGSSSGDMKMMSRGKKKSSKKKSKKSKT